MTYYGYRVLFRFRFACGCTEKVGPILEKFAYQYARLGAKRQCKAHHAPELNRAVRRVSGPHGTIELGWWTRQNGTRIFLTWEPASHWVRVYDPVRQVGRFGRKHQALVQIADRDTIWRVVGGDHLGGEWSEPAEEILYRFRAAANSDG